MSTTPVSSAQSPVLPTQAASNASGMAALTPADFLTLMTAQLKNQDPLNPTDSNEFLSQLAQLSTVSGITSMNTTMDNLSTSLLSSQALSSASLVGHGILTAAATASYVAGQPLSGAVQVPDGASSITLTITDAGGAVVRHITAAPGAGLQPFSWDGTTDSGTSAPSGTYHVGVNAIVNGSSQAATTLLNGTVTSVTLDPSGGGVTLNTPELGPIALSNVKQIS
ncbi:MAG TPA: flagellar hook capping FlgD N-terminal domain-containing protein [Steroidobacteraceae bacterium]|nr:flagellar hook capping FlgD N-terminal domain-containing protein [Steroidobacteraceae bacterium]